ncbi:hypothetical protein NC651_005859 [Populus alba x Populus x berolinensis]|nr:hypothetical protein NC651_005859 [Populus alba x Populus x berolinensis]
MLVVSGAGDAEVEVGNPNVVWSASEDGTLRQHDFREGASCPPGGSYPHECRNILKLQLGLLFFSGSSSLHLTHVRFSPNGDEVLLSYSGEHVYLMNVNYSDSYSGNAFCVRFEECCDPFLLEKLIRHSATVLRSSLVLCVQQQLDTYIRNTVVFVLFEKGIGHSDYVAGRSDDGRWFVWEKRTGRLIKMLLGDEAVVNCVQCHPFDCVVATSGIDSSIKAGLMDLIYVLYSCLVF